MLIYRPEPTENLQMNDINLYTLAKKRQSFWMLLFVSVLFFARICMALGTVYFCLVVVWTLCILSVLGTKISRKDGFKKKKKNSKTNFYWRICSHKLHYISLFVCCDNQINKTVMYHLDVCAYAKMWSRAMCCLQYFRTFNEYNVHEIGNGFVSCFLFFDVHLYEHKKHLFYAQPTEPGQW